MSTETPEPAPTPDLTPKVRAVVSGSFRRAMPLVREAIEDLRERGVLVLSPADIRIVDQHDGFVFVASDRVREVRAVEDGHLAAIDRADFVWLVSPDGYVGPSAAMEIGYAVARGVPVFGSTAPNDVTLSRYVTKVVDQTCAVIFGGRRCSDISMSGLGRMFGKDHT